MFTGIIEEIGAVGSLRTLSSGARIEIGASEVLSDVSIGASIAVNGCCLTVTSFDDRSFTADLSPETLDKTNLGSLRAGARVNLERPLSPTGRLSGHFVLGHVDGVGELTALEQVGDGNWRLAVRAPADLAHYLVYKGSVALDGISLTVAKLDSDVLEVALIPHTYEHTNLNQRRPGDAINVECDMIAKHVDKLLSRVSVSKGGLSLSDLTQQGF